VSDSNFSRVKESKRKARFKRRA